MLRLFDVKGNVQQAKHRRIKCDEPGEVRRERSGGRRRRIEGEASLAAAAVKNAVCWFAKVSSPAPDKFKWNLDVSMCIQIFLNHCTCPALDGKRHRVLDRRRRSERGSSHLKRCTVHLRCDEWNCLGVTPCALPLKWNWNRGFNVHRFKCDELRRVRRRCEPRRTRVDLELS